MSSGRVIPRAWQRWLILLAVWTAIGLSFAAQFYISSSRRGQPIRWGYAVNYALFDWYVCALLSLPVMWLSRRFPVERANWYVVIPIHLVASALFSFTFVVLRTWVAQIQGWFSQQPTAFEEMFQLLLLKS